MKWQQGALGLAAVGGLGLGLAGCEKATPAPPAATPPTTQATQPTTSVAKRAQLPPYLEFAKAIDPRIATTQPLGVPVSLDEGIALVTSDPVYVGPVGHLWITQPDAPPAEQVLRQKELTADLPHVVRDRVLFAHWTPDDDGIFHPTLITAGADGKPLAVSSTVRTPIPTSRAYHWDRAISWDTQIIVPTDTGVGIITIAPKVTEQYVDLIATPASSRPTDAKPNAPRPEWVFDAKGILAFIPWQNGQPGGNGAFRFVDGKWAHLDSWPAKVFHLIPLIDGSVLQLVTRDDGGVTLATASLDSGPVDEKRIEQLVDQLSDVEAQKRTDAFNELARFGPASWAVLERLKDNQPPETQTYLAQLLENREQPTLGGFKPLGPKLQVVSRLADSGVVIYTRAGVETHEGFRAAPTPITPAWLSIRPGRNVEILSTQMVGDLDPDRTRIIVHGDEWVVVTPAQGARRFLANHYETILPKSKAAYTDWQGTDRRGRWVFQKPATPDRPATTTQPSALSPQPSTLIIDPTVPDPAPRLPCWPIVVKGGLAGWSADGWPAVKRGGAWALQTAGWKVLDERKDGGLIDTAPPPPPPLPEPPRASAATSGPADMPATTRSAATAPAERPLLVDADGTRYYDGTHELRIVSKDNHQTVVTLPAKAEGTGPVTLIHAGENRLFLFNQPGRVVRLGPPDDANPAWHYEATFTKHVPTAPNRIWKDPAGRIVIHYDQNKLNILFPEGRVPPPLQPLVPNLGDDD